jgi:threonine aldolase
VTSGRKSFGSDNHAGAHPAVLAALTIANAGDVPSYGDDPLTARVSTALAESLGTTPDRVYFVFNGTGANVIGLSLMLRPHEAAICPVGSHLDVDECGAAERVLGNKLLTVPAPDGKLTPELVRSRLNGLRDTHHVQPRVVAISQVTEVGTVYTLAELAELRRCCQEHGLLLYLDGARLANAAAALGCSLGAIAAHADVLSFGVTKNGALGAEAVIIMNPEVGEDARFRRKQLMQLGSKMRFIAAQFDAMLSDELWLHNAQHANAMARRLADNVADIPGIRLDQPAAANAVFAELPAELITALRQDWVFHTWDEDRNVVRWMTAFDTTPADVDQFVASIRANASAGVSG